jgi:hypothetical protein
MTTLEHQHTRALVDADAAWRRAKPGTGIPFVASTETRARDGLVLRGSGWRTDRYRSNGVILWCHQHDQPPVGRAELARTAGPQLRGVAYFDQDDEFALKVERKYRSGIMNGFSVGWDFVDDQGQPIDWRRARPDVLQHEAFYELNEISAVPVPSDPNALTERTHAGMRALASELHRLFDPAPAVTGIKPTAARDLLAAFDLKGAPHER